MMSEKIDDGGRVEHMKLRDYFAAAALQGLIANNHDWEEERPPDGVETLGDWQRHFGRTAYEYADAMLKARKQ